MQSIQAVAACRRLRHEPLWRLLAADNGPIIIGLLQVLFPEPDAQVPASLLTDRLNADLDMLRANGEHLPQTAQGYLADWLREGFIERRFPPGASEEVFELSTSAGHAIRFVANLIRPQPSATESRLASLMQQLVRLADETDTNPETRLASLAADRDRIERQMTAVREGHWQALPDERALERIREILIHADDLTGDFRRVRDEFEQLNRQLRARLVDDDGHRGDVLASMFAGIDLIGESEAGRTFRAFWRLLNEPEQSAALETAIEHVLQRSFATRLELRERRFLQSLTRALLEQGGIVHDVLQNFARSLKQFVQSREYLEQRRLHQVLREAQRTALTIKESVKAIEDIGYTMTLSSGRIRSLSQWQLHDPTLRADPAAMTAGDNAVIDLALVGDMVAQADIDFRTLKAHVRQILDSQAQATIADVLAIFPAQQGLGSIVGLMALGSRHGQISEQTEHVRWPVGTDRWQSAHIPRITFVQERQHELV